MADPSIEQRLRSAARHLDDASHAHIESAHAYARPIRTIATTRAVGARRPPFLVAAAALVIVAVMGVLAAVHDDAHVTVPAARPVDPELVVLVAYVHRRAHGYNDEFSHGEAQAEVFGPAVHVLVTDADGTRPGARSGSTSSCAARSAVRERSSRCSADSGRSTTPATAR